MSQEPERIGRPLWRGAGFLLAAALLAASVAPVSSQEAGHRVTIKDEKAVVTEAVLPVDPVKRIQFGVNGFSPNVRSERGETLHLSSYFPTIKIDDKLYQTQGGAGQPGRAEYTGKRLPNDKGPKWREAYQSAYVFDDVRIVMTVTLVPGKPSERGGKRQLDAVAVHYSIENKGTKPHKVGLRVYMDTYIVNNDRCNFAAPTMPGKLLNGVELKGKTLPPYVQLLQTFDLKNPGYVAHLTLDLGGKFEKAERVVLTQHGNGWDGWEMQPLVAGDTGLGVFWEPKELRPGGKREIAYGYGKGIATNPENEGRVELALGGSFEPGKLFTVTARVNDPAPGQSLTLELPEGMELVEGARCQPVPEPAADEPVSVVLWRARVNRAGDYPVRVSSSTGVRQGKLISIAPAR